MTWKVVNNSDAGDADHFGGNDVDKISQLFSATSAVDTVDINSDWTFRNNRLFIRNPANTFSYQFTAAAIVANRVITLPLLTAGDTLVTEAFAQTLTNKTISPASNTLSGVAVQPTTRRWGMVQPSQGNTVNTTGTAVSAKSGMFENHVGTGASASNTFDTTEGVLASYVSTASAGSNAGMVSPTVGVTCRRLFGMRMICRVSNNSTTNGRFFVGFTSATSPPNSATPLATTDNGIYVGWSESVSNWTIYSNDGATSVTTTNVTGPIAKDTAFHTIEINWTAAGNPNVIFDGTSQSISTDLPSTTANLLFNCYAQASTTTAKTLLLKGVWIEADK